MATMCRYCGLESQKADVCTWCGKPIGAAQVAHPQAPAQPADAPGAAREAEEEEPEKRPAWVYAVSIAAALVLILLVLFGGLIGPKAPAEPQDWQTVNSKTGTLSLEVPGNWTFSTSGAESRFESVYVKAAKLSGVKIGGNPALGAMGDVSSAAARVKSDGSGQGPQRVNDAQLLHTFLGDVAKHEDPNYQEQGEMKPCKFAGREAGYSYYTSQRRHGLRSIPVKGLRLTAPAGEFAYVVRAECPAQYWEQFEPVADRIIKSVEMKE